MATIDRQAWRFFLRHAGGIVGQAAVTALALARAERHAEEQGWYCEWDDDPDPDWSWFDGEPGRHDVQLVCTLRDRTGAVLASIGCVRMQDYDTPATHPYCRVVEAQLALMAINEAEDAELDRQAALGYVA